MLVLGPIIFGLIIGLIVGSLFKSSSYKFPLSAFIVIIISGILMAWQLGQFDFYNDVPISTGFVSGMIGLLIGNIIFARGQ